VPDELLKVPTSSHLPVAAKSQLVRTVGHIVRGAQDQVDEHPNPVAHFSSLCKKQRRCHWHWHDAMPDAMQDWITDIAHSIELVVERSRR
jgi:predicted esterase